MKCRKCGSVESVKNGLRLGRQRYRCKGCGFQYTKGLPKGKDLESKCLAVILYANGMSFRAIAKIVKSPHKAVYGWARKFGADTCEKPMPVGPTAVELDGMWHFAGAKKASFGYGKHIVVIQVNS